MALVTVLLSPWIMGIRVSSADTSWGPGFQIRRFDVLTDLPMETSIVQDSIRGRTISVKRIAFEIGSGSAIPAPEGPRPLGGHGWVLLGGQWKSLVNQLDQERIKAIRQAILMQVPILHDAGTDRVLIHLLRMGFITNDPKDRFSPDGISARRFSNKRGEQVIILRLKDRSTLFQLTQLNSLISISQKNEMVLYSTYSSTLRKCFNVAPESIQPLGSFSGVLNIDSLRKAIEHS
jgi:hypothetical protein